MEESQKILKLAVSIVEILLKSGGEIYRVQDTVERVMEAYGLGDYHVFVVSNGIFATVHEEYQDRGSIVRYVPLGSTDLGKIQELNQLSREICAHTCTVEEAYRRLEQCKSRTGVSRWKLVLIGAMACAAFCHIYGGGWMEILVAFFLGILLELFLQITSGGKTSKFIINIIGSAMVTAVSFGLAALGLPFMQDLAVIGTIILLVPGVALTTSIRELFNGDYLSGCIHLMDALMSAVCIAVGVGASVSLFQLFARIEVSRSVLSAVGNDVRMLMQFMAAMLGTLAFAIIFHAPRKEYLFCTVNGGLGWLAYLLFLRFGAGVTIASLGATLFLTLAARVLSAVRRCPTTVFLVTGIFTLVPGAGIYYTAYYLLMNELAQFTAKGIETFKVAGAIALGIVFGFAIPQSWFNRLSLAWNRRKAGEAG